jgi:hypothetical protein
VDEHSISMDRAECVPRKARPMTRPKDPTFGGAWSAQATDIAPVAGVGAVIGAQGQQGLQGDTGAAGAQGPPGPSVVPSGATGARPSSPVAGAVYLDLTISKPVFYDGTNWIDSTGATV